MIRIVGRDDAVISGDITYFEAPRLKALGLVNHAFCTRKGSVHGKPHPSAILGGVRDQKRVLALLHMESVANTVGFEPKRLITMQQIHEDRIWIIHTPLPPSGRSSNCRSDAILTDQRDIAIGVLTADCVPILLADPDHAVIGAVHAGWRGTLQGIARKVLDRMIHRFGTRPEDLFVAVGPSIGECCYEVDEAVMGPFRSSGWNWQSFSRYKGKEKWYLDLALANIEQMRDAGMRDERCSWIRVCTACNNDILFSYRAEGTGVGEQISFIQLQG